MTLVLNPAAFNALLSNIRPGLGQACLWRKSFLCPCRSSTSGAALQGCPVCAGKGVSWDAPITAWTSLAGMKITREWANFGLFEQGDTVITIPSDSPLYALGEGDRVSFTDSSEPFGSVLTRGIDLLPFNVTVIDRVVWKDPVTHLLVTGGLPTQASDRTLSWALSGDETLPLLYGVQDRPLSIPGGAPPSGIQYSITGRKVPEYWCFQDFSQDRHHHGGLPLPRRCVLRKWDLFGR